VKELRASNLQSFHIIILVWYIVTISQAKVVIYYYNGESKSNAILFVPKITDRQKTKQIRHKNKAACQRFTLLFFILAIIAFHSCNPPSNEGM